MILSRVPFHEDRPVARFERGHTRVPVVFTLDGKELVMYPVHLLSPGKLSLVAEHREQIREFLEIERQEKRPMVIVGDCNMTPQTPNFQALRNVGFRSTYELAGFGLCNTWGPRWWPRLYKLPGVQIDQMLLQPPLTAKWHHVGLDTGSDHRPIVAEIGFGE
jgi:endonuclease/exonuclease/phosphatase (EEP) superfamily protein YafD